MKLIRIIFIIITITATTACAGSPVTVKLHVVDDDGKPVQNATVGMGFLLGQGANIFKGHTDENGYVTATKRASYGVSISVTKDGYYRSGHRTGYGDQDLTLVLREKKNPIAMYAKKARTYIPKKKQTLWFDFEKGDWVAPYGEGSEKHMSVYFDGEQKDFWNYSGEMKIGFANENDGLFRLTEKVDESVFKLPYMAVTNGYENSLKYTKKRSKKEGDRGAKRYTNRKKNTTGYFFRVNTEVDGEGEIINANYGKISGDIFFSPKSQDDDVPGYIWLTYYFNPTTNDRNMEFDIAKNLFTDLKGLEKVREP